MLGFRQFRDSRYLVNQCGRVINMRTGRELMGERRNRHAFHLRIDGKTVYIRRDKMVAELFVSNPFRFKYIAHKNGDIFDDDFSNLEWVPYRIRFVREGNMGRSGVRGVMLRNGKYVVSIGGYIYGSFETKEEAEFEYLDALHTFYAYPLAKHQKRYQELLRTYRKPTNIH